MAYDRSIVYDPSMGPPTLENGGLRRVNQAGSGGTYISIDPTKGISIYNPQGPEAINYEQVNSIIQQTLSDIASEQRQIQSGLKKQYASDMPSYVSNPIMGTLGGLATGGLLGAGVGLANSLINTNQDQPAGWQGLLGGAVAGMAPVGTAIKSGLNISNNNIQQSQLTNALKNAQQNALNTKTKNSTAYSQYISSLLGALQKAKTSSASQTTQQSAQPKMGVGSFESSQLSSLLAALKSRLSPSTTTQSTAQAAPQSTNLQSLLAQRQAAIPGAMQGIQGILGNVLKSNLFKQLGTPSITSNLQKMLGQGA